MFRVVQDQLRVSEGWVRCGRCDTVFQAHDALMDLVESPPLSSEDGEFAPPPSALARGITASNTPRRPSEPLGVSSPSHDTDFPPTEWAGTQAPSFDDSAPPDTTLRQPEAVRAPDPAPDRAPSGEAASAAPLSAAASSASSVKPGFVRQAERQDRWRSPATRAAMGFMALVLAGLLAGQVAFHHRDWVAARSPAAKALFTQVCARWGCTVEAPRTLRHVTLEGSGLARVAQDSQAVRLTVNLRNRGSTDIAVPSIDLSLTDATGQLIARRALSPADFRVEPAVIEGNSERQLELLLSAGDQAVTGYTVELFYP